MNKRDIVLNAIAHKTGTVCPYNIDFTEAMRENMRRHYGLADTRNVSARVGNYIKPRDSP